MHIEVIFYSGFHLPLCLRRGLFGCMQLAGPQASGDSSALPPMTVGVLGLLLCSVLPRSGDLNSDSHIWVATTELSSQPVLHVG